MSVRLGSFIAALKLLPFIRDVRFQGASENGMPGEGVLAIIDREKRPFEFRVQAKPSYLDRTSTNAVIAEAQFAEHQGRPPTLILARYIPAPTGERLMGANVNFMDLVGNMHLVLGTHYGRTMLGRQEPQKTAEHRGVTGAQLRLLFLFATRPESAAWPVRDLAVQTGVSKSKAADERRRLVEAGVIHKENGAYRYRASPDTEVLLVSGYAQVLRPRLLVGRFRAPERNPEDFLERLPSVLKESGCRFSLTGGPAADLLHPFYRGPDIPIFLTDAGPEVCRRLRILPDRAGPIIVLRAFVELVFWRNVSSLTVAPPWLVYAELMNASDPRAHEAAMEFRQEFLLS